MSSISMLLHFLPLLMELAVAKRISRIVGGAEVAPNSLPYTVSVQDELSTHICGGSVISSELVISSGLCCLMASALTVVGGEHNLFLVEGNEQVVDVASVNWHPDFDDATLENDICLLNLQFPLVLNQEVSAVSLPSAMAPTPIGSAGLISGWGTLGEDAGAPDVLHSVQLRILDDNECQDKYESSDGPYDVYPELMLCAGDEGQGFCRGDFGGPLVVDGQLYGLASWSDGCGQGFPAVFVEVAYYVDWIQQHLEEFSQIFDFRQ